MPKSAAVIYDADAQTYFNANTYITSSADKTAINNFYLGLKSDGIYNKFKYIYLPIWGASSGCKWNLVNPQDTDAAFRMTFATGITYNSSGMVSNGTTGYANTHFIPSLNGTLNSHHISYYSRTNSNGTEVEMGVNSSGTTILEIRTSGTTYAAINSASSYSTFADTDSRGFYIANRTASNVINVWRNGTKKVTGSTASTSLPNLKMNLLAWNNNGLNMYYSLKECAFASSGDGLTDTESINFSSRVNTLLTYFGINVY